MLRTEGGGLLAAEGTVEFTAHRIADGERGAQREVSRSSARTAPGATSTPADPASPDGGDRDRRGRLAPRPGQQPVATASAPTTQAPAHTQEPADSPSTNAWRTASAAAGSGDCAATASPATTESAASSRAPAGAPGERVLDGAGVDRAHHRPHDGDAQGAPDSRMVSLTADPAPALSGRAPMTASVAGPRSPGRGHAAIRTMEVTTRPQ